MNRILPFAGTLLMMAAGSNSAHAVEQLDSWTETFALETRTPSLELSNIWGNINVHSGPDGVITMDIRERRYAPDQVRFDRSVETLNLHIEADDAVVSMYVGNRERNWRGHNRCRGCRVEYQFDVRVPAGTLLDLSTVNDGRIDVQGVSGAIIAGNVNGPIAISGLHDCVELNNVNGRIDLSFARAPGRDCQIETINGDVVFNMPNGSGLDLAVDLFNGTIKTELPVEPVAIPAIVELTENNGRYRYRIEQPTGLRIADGGPRFTISSMNGDIRIQKSR